MSVGCQWDLSMEVEAGEKGTLEGRGGGTHRSSVRAGAGGRIAFVWVPQKQTLRQSYVSLGGESEQHWSEVGK